MNPPSHVKKLCIVGSGLVGTLLASLLAKEGFVVDVYEKRKDPRREVDTQGRTIALSLSDRGWKALRSVGLENEIRKNTNPGYGRTIHHPDDTVNLQNYSDGSKGIHTVNRNYLNTTLLAKASSIKGVTFYFEHEFKDLDETTGEISFTDLGSNKEVKKRYDHIFGIDGVFSAVRKCLEAKWLWKFESSVLDFGYKELRVVPNAPGRPELADHRVHVWPRKNSVLMGFPTTDGYIAASLFLPVIGENSLASLSNKDDFIGFLKQEYADVIPYLPTLEADIINNPDSILTQVKGWPWHFEDKVLLMGDACHAITPFYGMGMNIGFEDATIFMELLKLNDFDFKKTFEAFEAARKPNTDAMYELSYKNFKSLSESPDPEYQSKWLLERRIWKILPERWTPIYVLIAFSDTHIGAIPAIKEKQDNILDKLLSDDPDIMALSDEELKALVEPFLESSPVSGQTLSSAL